jgi:hypothetical protein
VELDRQSIERRDFPIGRRGYAPAAVDAHLQVLADAVEELQLALAGRGADSLAASAGTQVQAIVAAAEVAAAEIESDANANAQRTRAEAQADAERTRAEAIAQAQAHVAAVGRATATLLARVEALDGETGGLVESLRAGATRLAGDLAAVETNMGELYDAAAGRASAPGAGANGEPVVAVAEQAHPRAPEPPLPEPPPEAPAEPVAAGSVPSSASRSSVGAPPIPAPAPVPSPSVPSPSASSQTTSTPSSPPSGTATPGPPKPVSAKPAPAPSQAAALVENGDLDGARLVALNMALNGDSREETDRYLAEHYEVADRTRLLDEVYAAIEG